VIDFKKNALRVSGVPLEKGEKKMRIVKKKEKEDLESSSSSPASTSSLLFVPIHLLFGHFFAVLEGKGVH